MRSAESSDKERGLDNILISWHKITMTPADSECVWHGLSLAEPPRIILAGNPRHGLRQRSARYLLAQEWSLHLYHYHGWLEVGARRYRIEPLAVSLIPPGTEFTHLWESVDSWHVFHLIRLGRTGCPVRLREFSPPLADGEVRYAALKESAGWVTREPERASARVWDFLWSQAERIVEPVGTAGQHPAVSEALRALERAQPDEPDLRCLAKRCGVSVNHLIRLFRAATGRTPIAFWQERRLNRAARLLSETRWSVKAVSYEVGFSDPTHFCRRFRAHFGVTPQTYRHQKS